MALWKQNLDEILGRALAIKNADDPNYDETRVQLEPSVRRNPPRMVKTNLAARLSALRSSSQSSTSSSLPAQPPTSGEMDQLPSPTGASLLSQGDAFSLFSGFSDEGRSINKHRPDEALINMTMLLFAQGACLPLLQRPSHKDYAWSIVHKQYSITRPDAEKEETKTILTARTDGYLQARRPGCLPDDDDALAIIEVKPYRRHNPPGNLKAVRIQESAEMASWISAESKKGLLPPCSGGKRYRRLLVSQDFDYVFLSIAEYDDQYVEYVRGTVNAPKSDLPPLQQLTTPKKRVDTIKAIKKKTSKFLDTFKHKSPVAMAPPSPTATSTDEPEAVPEDDRATAAPKDESKAAPKQGLGSGPNPGFLRMIEFDGFNLGKEADIRKLTVLLCSLTDYLVSKDLALRGQ
ncbi:hypothetical protein CEP54_007664 [Fusarium duplospermum]|uniref:Uncharacterized protein n=1 Tax=Fusarium duplospermum TaxID=1325734 RepID=A0A428Q084_9HYPO|nr:hypothetical protein CEP54_007664 [Fusarium duplospermum]